MQNPLSNNSYINHLQLIFVLLIILINSMITYGLMWNPYSIYFDRPELSSIDFETRDLLATGAAIFHFSILFILTITLFVKFIKFKRIFYITPTFSIISMMLIYHLNSYSPDASSRYTLKGYQYLEQNWYLDGEVIFKKFKSKQTAHSYKDERTIVWQLDSIAHK